MLRLRPITLLLIAATCALAAPAPALAQKSDEIIQDCYEDGKLDGSYTNEELENAEDDMSDREAIQAPATRVSVFEARECQGDQRRREEHRADDAWHDVLAPRRGSGRVNHEERRLQLRAERDADIAV